MSYPAKERCWCGELHYTDEECSNTPKAIKIRELQERIRFLEAAWEAQEAWNTAHPSCMQNIVWHNPEFLTVPSNQPHRWCNECAVKWNALHDKKRQIAAGMKAAP